MDFKECLNQIASSLDGCVAATLMSHDGLPIETVEGAAEAPDFATLLIELTAVLGQVRDASASISAGSLEELSIRSENLTTIIRPVTPEYFLALALQPNANAGKGRYLLRVQAPKLVAELS